MEMGKEKKNEDEGQDDKRKKKGRWEADLAEAGAGSGYFDTMD